MDEEGLTGCQPPARMPTINMRQTDDWIVKDLRDLYVASATRGKRGTPTRAASFACVTTCRVLLALFTPVETRFLEDVANI